MSTQPLLTTSDASANLEEPLLLRNDQSYKALARTLDDRAHDTHCFYIAQDELQLEKELGAS
jgi:hypothetical protein